MLTRRRGTYTGRECIIAGRTIVVVVGLLVTVVIDTVIAGLVLLNGIINIVFVGDVIPVGDRTVIGRFTAVVDFEVITQFGGTTDVQVIGRHTAIIDGGVAGSHGAIAPQINILVQLDVQGIVTIRDYTDVPIGQVISVFGIAFDVDGLA
ncbi:hypothetical protein LMG33818_001669 [Halomonadaceae bacterium LMG 33818]